MGDGDGPSRFLLVAVVTRGISGLVPTVFVRGRPLRPDDLCCCSESEVTGAGVLGISGFIFGGLPTFRLGGFGVSDLFDMTDCDRLKLPAGVTLCSRVVAFVLAGGSRLLRPSDFSAGFTGDADSVSENGLTSRSRRVGLRGLNPGRGFLLFHGVDVALEKTEPLLSDLGIGVLPAEAGY